MLFRQIDMTEFSFSSRKFVSNPEITPFSDAAIVKTREKGVYWEVRS